MIKDSASILCHNKEDEGEDISIFCQSKEKGNTGQKEWSYSVESAMKNAVISRFCR